MNVEKILIVTDHNIADDSKFTTIFVILANGNQKYCKLSIPFSNYDLSKAFYAFAKELENI